MQDTNRDFPRPFVGYLRVIKLPESALKIRYVFVYYINYTFCNWLFLNLYCLESKFEQNYFHVELANHLIIHCFLLTKSNLESIRWKLKTSYTLTQYYAGYLTKCILHWGFFFLPRFFDQVGHQTTYASMGNKHFITK